MFAGPSITAIAGGVCRGARVARGGQFGEEGTHAGEGGADDAAGGLDLRPDVDACGAPGGVGAGAERGDVGDADDGDGADAVCGVSLGGWSREGMGKGGVVLKTGAWGIGDGVGMDLQKPKGKYKAQGNLRPQIQLELPQHRKRQAKHNNIQ
jgi:hypothetical protein